MRLEDHGHNDSDVVSIPTEPGDLIVWHQDMIHGSQPNRSSRSRIAVASIYHGWNEEEKLRQEHRKGAIRRRPNLAWDGRSAELLDAYEPVLN